MSHAMPSKGGPLRGIWYLIRDVVVIVVVAVVISTLVKTFIARPFYIPSGSMEHTLEVDDKIMVSLLTPQPIGLNRGDVVVFKDPGGWLSSESAPAQQQWSLGTGIADLMTAIGLGASDSHQYLVKRVIGLPGDHVQCTSTSDKLRINGAEVDEPYIPEGSTPCSAGRLFDVTVPDGSVWVMGDNRQNSLDSSAHQDLPGGGTLSEDMIVGRAFVITWPANRWTWLGDYPEVFENVPAAGQQQSLAQGGGAAGRTQ